MNSGRTYLQQAAQPTGATVFANLAAAQTIGGWGSFTAQIFRFRDGWGKSFGTIGYSAGASALTMGQAWNYKWMCGAAQATENVGKPCDATWTFSAADTTTIPVPSTTAINAVPLVTLVCGVLKVTSRSPSLQAHGPMDSPSSPPWLPQPRQSPPRALLDSPEPKLSLPPPPLPSPLPPPSTESDCTRTAASIKSP